MKNHNESNIVYSKEQSLKLIESQLNYWEKRVERSFLDPHYQNVNVLLIDKETGKDVVSIPVESRIDAISEVAKILDCYHATCKAYQKFAIEIVSPVYILASLYASKI